MLHQLGIEISHETVRVWRNRFGPKFAAGIRRKRVDRMLAYTHWWGIPDMPLREENLANLSRLSLVILDHKRLEEAGRFDSRYLDPVKLTLRNA